MVTENNPVRRRAACRAVVTGAGRGLGRAMALGLLDAGYDVLIVDHDEGLIGEALAAAHERGRDANAFGVWVDLTAPDVAASVMRAAEDQMGGIDILVNNAGIGPAAIRKDYFANPPNFDDLTDADVRLFFELNGIAPMLLCVHAARRMRKQGWGRIVNVTTSLDSMVRRGFAPYSGTKASLEGHSATMAGDLASSGVTVNVLVPGGVADTGMIPPELGFDRAQLIRPEAMVAPLLWLLADVAAPVSGKRVLAALWTADADAGNHPAVAPIGWPSNGSKAILPGMTR